MNPAYLQQLLRQPEGPNLEFKGEFYALDHPDQKAKARQRGELIKDVLALANGNVTTAGETAYLIVGVDNQQQADGSRIINGIPGESDAAQWANRIRDLVNDICAPKIADIWGEIVALDGKTIFILALPASPHLYETTKRLDTKDTTYNEYTVFLRSGEGVKIASTQERSAIADLKRLRYAESRNAPPVGFGAIVGAVSIGVMSANRMNQIYHSRKKALIGLLMGSLVGSFLGAQLGNMWQIAVESASIWRYRSRHPKLRGK